MGYWGCPLPVPTEYNLYPAETVFLGIFDMLALTGLYGSLDSVHTILWTTGITKALMLTHHFESLNILPLCKQATNDLFWKKRDRNRTEIQVE